MKRVMLITATCTLMLTGCATPYQKGGRFGYRDSQLQENVFSVSFQGNGKCEPQDVQDYTLLRCAELCIQNGYKYFALNSTGAGAKRGVYNTGGSATTYGTMNTIGPTTYGNFNTYGSPGFAMPIHHPNYSAIVTCYREKPEQEVFDAEYLGRSVAEKHGYTFVDGMVAKPQK